MSDHLAQLIEVVTDLHARGLIRLVVPQEEYGRGINIRRFGVQFFDPQPNDQHVRHQPKHAMRIVLCDPPAGVKATLDFLDGDQQGTLTFYANNGPGFEERVAHLVVQAVATGGDAWIAKVQGMLMDARRTVQAPVSFGKDE